MSTKNPAKPTPPPITVIEDQDNCITETARASDHITGTQIRNGCVIYFSETNSKDRTITASTENGADVLCSVSSAPSQNEDGTLETCQRLVHFFNRNEPRWEQPELVPTKHLDAIAKSLLTPPANDLRIQVVRAQSDSAFWKKLGQERSAEITGSYLEAANALKDAIEKKIAKIPKVLRADITLVLDATDTPALSFNGPVDAFNSTYGSWSMQQGFYEIWIVGLGSSLIHQLHAKPSLR